MDKDRLISILEPVCSAHNVELIDAALVREQGGTVLRVLIDRAGEERFDKKGRRIPGSGVALSDCQLVSRDLGVALDVHDIVPGRYRLEVGSPGVDRPLTKPAHYEAWRGSEAKITTKFDMDGRRNFTGFIEAFENGNVVLRMPDSDTPARLAFDNIAKAHLVYRFD